MYYFIIASILTLFQKERRFSKKISLPVGPHLTVPIHTKKGRRRQESPAGNITSV